MQTDLCLLVCLCAGGGREMRGHAGRTANAVTPISHTHAHTHTIVQVNKPPRSLSICTAVMEAVFPGLA